MFLLEEDEEKIKEILRDGIAKKHAPLSADLRHLKETSEYQKYIDFIKKSLVENKPSNESISKLTEEFVFINKELNNLLNDKINIFYSGRHIVFNSIIDTHIDADVFPEIDFYRSSLDTAGEKYKSKSVHGSIPVKTKKNVNIQYGDTGNIKVSFNDQRERDFVTAYYQNQIYQFLTQNQKEFSSVFFSLTAISKIAKEMLKANVKLEDIVGKSEQKIEGIYNKIKDSQEIILLTTDLKIDEELAYLEKQIIKNKKIKTLKNKEI